jgi:cytochrome P450
MTTVDPIIYDPLSVEVQADPYPTYAALRHAAPVYYVESLDAYAVSRHADVRQVMRDHGTFSSEAMAELLTRPVAYADGAEHVDDGGASDRSLIGTDGATHQRLRTIVNRGFTPRRVAALEAEVREIAGAFARSLVASGAGDLQSEFAVPFPTTVIAALLGVGPDRRDEFRRWSEHMVLAVFEPTTPQQQADIARNSEEMGFWLDEVVAARQAFAGDDLISVLLRAELEGGALTHEELRGFVFTLLVAGSITTAYLIGSAVLTLARDAELERRARREPAVIAQVVEETLRHEAPVQMMFRTATEPVELSGSAIPQGATVLALLGSANRDEQVFPDPDRFDPDRDTSEHVAFGHGVHFCLGAALARIEARIAIDELLAAAPRLELAGDVERVESLVFRGPTRVPLRFA